MSNFIRNSIIHGTASYCDEGLIRHYRLHLFETFYDDVNKLQQLIQIQCIIRDLFTTSDNSLNIIGTISLSSLSIVTHRQIISCTHLLT